MSIPIIWNEDVNNVEGHLDDQARWLRKDLPPGSGCWVKGMDGQIAALRFVCPCGCGGMGFVPIQPGYGGAACAECHERSTRKSHAGHMHLDIHILRTPSNCQARHRAAAAPRLVRTK